MRGRGGQRGRGSTVSGRGTKEWGTKLSAQQNGPLMTDHLRDIDIELEILNRRRQMLQQEHDLLDREREFNLKRQYQYEQPLTSYNQPNYYHKQGNKRLAVERAPSKQFNPPARVEPWEQYAQSINPSYAAKPPPLLSLPRNRPTRPVTPRNTEFRQTRPTPPVRNNFNPTKVTKQKARTGYLKKTLLSDPKEIKPKPNVTTPIPNKVPPKSSVPSTDAAIKDDEFILRHDVQPSPQLNGRLELALGAILKDIKQMYPSNFSHIANSSQSQRFLKQIIRERIRSVMLDKKVGHMQDIIAFYRKKYPVETDAQLLQIGQDCKAYNIHTLGIMPTINSEHVKEFFKANLKNVLYKKLEKLFSPCKDSDKNIDKMMDEVVDLQDNVGEDQTQIPDTTNVDFSKDELSEEEVIGRNIKKAKIYIKLMENLIDVKLPYIVTQHRESLVSLIDADMEYRLAKADVVEATVKEAVSLVAKKMENACVPEPTIENDTVAGEAELTKENESVSILETTLPQNISNSSVTDVKTPTSKITDHPYYVKLIGRPELPSRASVYAYLEQFKPASIKKHKTIGNLLVVGFDDKEACDRILEAGEKVIGENTITVKSSEKVTFTPQKQNPSKTENVDRAQQKIDNALNDTTTNETSLDNAALQISVNENCVSIEEENKNDDSEQTNLNNSFCISQDLEDQISNLLTVVGKEYDENNAKDNSNDNTNTAKELSDKNMGNEDKTTCERDVNIVEDTEKESEDIQTGFDLKSQAGETISNGSGNIDGKDTQNKHVNAAENTSVTENTKSPEEKEIKDSAQPVEVKDVKKDLKDSGRATPTRSSSRLASTPSTIKTRRASRLAQN